jgi:hypothetical protein
MRLVHRTVRQTGRGFRSIRRNALGAQTACGKNAANERSALHPPDVRAGSSRAAEGRATVPRGPDRVRAGP